MPTTPLAASAALAASTSGRPVRLGAPGAVDGPGWVRCADVDAAFVARWERAVAARHVREHGRSHPAAAAAYVLGWYAGVPAELGGALFRLTRRVPRLDRAALAFRLGPEGDPDAVALLDRRFWCLAADPAVRHPDATVVADDGALAAVLRAQVREHADAFLADHPSRGLLPRRALLGAFADGLDTGLWRGGAADRAGLLADAALVLPGGSAAGGSAARGSALGASGPSGSVPGASTPGASTLPASTLQVRVDGRGRRHLDRRTLSCCYYVKLAPAAGPCGTCPRIPVAQRLARLTALPDA